MNAELGTRGNLSIESCSPSVPGNLPGSSFLQFIQHIFNENPPVHETSRS